MLPPVNPLKLRPCSIIVIKAILDMKWGEARHVSDNNEYPSPKVEYVSNSQ